jgi:hypothetical protein
MFGLSPEELLKYAINGGQLAALVALVLAFLSHLKTMSAERTIAEKDWRTELSTANKRLLEAHELFSKHIHEQDERNRLLFIKIVEERKEDLREIRGELKSTVAALETANSLHGRLHDRMVANGALEPGRGRG